MLPFPLTFLVLFILFYVVLSELEVTYIPCIGPTLYINGLINSISLIDISTLSVPIVLARFIRWLVPNLLDIAS